MLRILPLASSFHSPSQVRETIRRTSERLQGLGIAHEMVASAETANILFIITGGTEHLALKALEGRTGPVLLLAHPDQNSLPASLEILCHAQQAGRKGRIVLLNEREEGIADLRQLARQLEIRERMGACRMGRIGTPSDWLVGSMPDTVLAQNVWGPKVVDVPLIELRAAMDAATAEEVKALQEDFRQGASEIREASDQDLGMAAKVAAGLRHVIQDHRLDACTVRCFDLVLDLKTTGCLALSLLLDAGVVAGCEGDLPAALTMLWMQETSGRTTFMANPQDVDPAANTLWLAHCTIARRMLKRYTLRSHFESSLGVGIQGELEPGDYTLARIGGGNLRGLFLSNAALIENGQSELRCRTQVLLKLHEGVGDLLTRPMGNHHVLVPGHWGRELKAYHNLFIA